MTTTTTTTAPPNTIEDHLDAMYAAFERTSNVMSGRVAGSIDVYRVDPPQLESEPVASVPFDGAFDRRSGDFSSFIDWEHETGTAAPDGTTAVFTRTWTRRVGDRAYFKDGYWTGRLDPEADWISVPAEHTDDILMPSLNDPSDLIENLPTIRASLSEATVLGVDVDDSAVLNGEPTTHYHVAFDDQELLADATAEILSVDVWVSDTGLLARFAVRYKGAMFVARDGYQTVDRTDLFDLDTSIVIEPPPASEVTAIEDIEGSGFTDDG